MATRLGGSPIDRLRRAITSGNTWHCGLASWDGKKDPGYIGDIGLAVAGLDLLRRYVADPEVSALFERLDADPKKAVQS